MAGESEGFLGGATVHQIVVWGVLVELLNSILQPVLRKIEYTVNEAAPNLVLTPDVLADAVVRGVLPKDIATMFAHAAGQDDLNFTVMTDLAGEPPGLQQVLEWWRRGYLEWGDVGPDKATVANAIATSRIYTYWSDVIKKAQLVPPSPADAINAVLRNQITEEQGIAMAYFGGLGLSSLEVPAEGDAADTKTAFDILVNTAGRPPSPGELADFVRRGLIPLGDTNPATKTPSPAELSFAQGIYEGDTKDKWLPIYAALVKYIPPPRSIIAVYKAGGYTPEQALALLKENGMDDADATAYLQAASGEKQAGTVQVALGVIQTLYYDQAIDALTATAMLNSLGYSNQEAAFELAVQDLKRTQAAVTGAVSRIQTLYVDHKINITTAGAALGRLNIPGTQITQLIQTWTVEAGSNVKLLTQAEIVDAWSINIIDESTALNDLQALGYTAFDAWVLLSIKNKGPVGQPPAAEPPAFYQPPPPVPGA